MTRSINNLLNSTFLTNLSSTTKKVCLVIIDHAALSTNLDDILHLVEHAIRAWLFIDKDTHIC